jgi:hypothetical protein
MFSASHSTSADIPLIIAQAGSPAPARLKFVRASVLVFTFLSAISIFAEVPVVSPIALVDVGQPWVLSHRSVAVPV